MIEPLAFVLFIATLPGTLELLLVTTGVLFFKSKPLSLLKKPPKTALLVPAHNEENSIQQTLQTLKKCSGKWEGFVIADNCTDQTEKFAQREGFEVLKRISPNRGKHYALGFAFDQLKDRHYDLYLIIDADTLVTSNFVEILQTYIQNGWSAVQGAYLLSNQGSYTGSRLASIAFTAFNAIRPMGRAAWGLSSGIYGSGIALKKELLEKIPFPTNTVVEDAAYHLKLVEKGIKVAFAVEARLTAEHPLNRKDAASQHKRWEGGRLRLWLDESFTLLKGVSKGNWLCLEPLLELSTPPLALYSLLLAPLLFTFYSFYAIGAFLILILHVGQTLLFRKEFSSDFKALLGIPLYLVRRLFSVVDIWKGSRKGVPWIRTKRKGE